MRIFLIGGCGLILLFLVSCTPAPIAARRTADDYNRLLGRGVNLGNALEAPREGAWGVTLKEDYFEEIAQAGFDSVRIPVKWSAQAEKEPPYTISERFLERVDWAVEQALARELVVVLNMHHYDEMATDPEAHLDRFLAIWAQLAVHYQAYPDTVYFEIMNEPNSAMTNALWHDFFTQALAVIRETNPRRMVIIGPVQWNNISQLQYLELPEDDRNLIVTYHYYEPFQFTHQGAEWVDGSERWLGRPWSGTEQQQKDVRRAFDRAARWAEANNRLLYLGEFGAYATAEMEDRVRWTAFVRQEAEVRGFSWAYWEFGAGFGVYDRGNRAWREPLLSALIPPDVTQNGKAETQEELTFERR